MNSGQALVEVVVSLTVLLLMFFAITLIGKYSDLAIKLEHSSRYVAFDWVQRERPIHDIQQDVFDRFLASPPQQIKTAQFESTSKVVQNKFHPLWVDHRGTSLLKNAAALPSVGIAGSGSMNCHSSGIKNLSLQALGSDRIEKIAYAFGIADSAIAQACVALPLSSFSESSFYRLLSSASRQGIGYADQNWIIGRHTNLLRLQGSPADDRQVQSRLEANPTSLGLVVNRINDSEDLVKPLIQGVALIDGAWGIKASSDWLTPWQAVVPADRLRDLPQ